MINHKKLLKELINELEKQFKDNFTGLILFGSYAKGTQKEYSDLDIILTFKKLPKSRIERFSLIRDSIMYFENKYNIEINPQLSQENLLEKTFLLLEISDYAKILLDKNKKIQKLFNEIKEDYKNGFVKKLIRDGYHILKIENV